MESLTTLRLVWNRRRLLAGTVHVAIRQRYAGSILGLGWLVLGPVLLLALYAAIYLVVFRVRPPALSAEIYVLYIFSGLVPFIGFSQALMQGATALSGDREVLLNTVFPPELVPLREVAASLVALAAGIGIILVVGITLGKVAWTWFLIPIPLALMFMFLAGVTWILSLANLVFRDIQQILVYLTIILLIASPIAYTPDMIPYSLAFLIYVNPLAYFVIFLQHVIVLGQIPPWPILLGSFVLSLGVMVFGAHVFSRAKLIFFDHA